MSCYTMANVILIVSITLISNSVITLANSLEAKEDTADAEIKQIIFKYINKIPDIESRYVIDEGLSKAIGHYFNGKVNTFPLYKISLKLDRNPVKIPWTLGEPIEDGTKQMIYRYIPRKKKNSEIKSP